MLDEIYINRLYTEYSEILKSYLNKIHLYKTQTNVKSIEFLELKKKKNEINKEKNLFLLDFNKIIISENSKYVLLNSVKNDELSRIIINNTFDSHNISFHDG
ncbi:MAG: hypothetical protein KDH96_11795 [Candidatus Riesia sp.]|nr:hypothetical protein [Candidatus Riesia sp.]